MLCCLKADSWVRNLGNSLLEQWKCINWINDARYSPVLFSLLFCTSKFPYLCSPCRYKFNILTRLISGSLVLTTLGKSTNISNGRTIIITYTENSKYFFSLFVAPDIFRCNDIKLLAKLTLSNTSAVWVSGAVTVVHWFRKKKQRRKYYVWNNRFQSWTIKVSAFYLFPLFYLHSCSTLISHY